MAMIVASALDWDQVQADGRRWVRERHEDDGGTMHLVDYLAEAELDAEERMAARVPQLEAQLAAEAEAREAAAIEEAVEAAKGAFFGAMTAAELKATLGLPAELEIDKNG